MVERTRLVAVDLCEISRLARLGDDDPSAVHGCVEGDKLGAVLGAFCGRYWLSARRDQSLRYAKTVHHINLVFVARDDFISLPFRGYVRHHGDGSGILHKIGPSIR